MSENHKMQKPKGCDSHLWQIEAENYFTFNHKVVPLLGLKWASLKRFNNLKYFHRYYIKKVAEKYN